MVEGIVTDQKKIMQILQSCRSKIRIPAALKLQAQVIECFKQFNYQN